MAGEIRREEGSYRRGLVMGLTMAEIMVLVVFCLLLLMGWSLRSSASGVAAEETLRATLDALAKAAGIDVRAPIPSDFLELVRTGRGTMDQMKKAELGSTAAEAQRLVALAVETQKAFGENTMKEDPNSAALEFVRDAGEAYKLAKRSTPYGSSAIWFQTLQKCAEKCGDNGLEYPPCARTSDGKAALIYTATLRPNAVTLHDNRIPELETARATWPQSGIAFDQSLSQADFLTQTRPMFLWSEERACRFFVEITDETGATEKMAYKLTLRTVEQHFYKHESLR